LGLGSMLVGFAVALVIGAYLARPFRVVRVGADPERTIETWVAQARAAEKAEGESICPRCGRRAEPDDCFCAGCGAPLQLRGKADPPRPSAVGAVGSGTFRSEGKRSGTLGEESE